MIITIDTASETPIYLQLRNEILRGIGTGELAIGERLPTVRQMAADIGVNTMTVNKTYQMLKQEGYIVIDRRAGASVSLPPPADEAFTESITRELTLLSAEASLHGIPEQTFLELCRSIFQTMREVPI